MISDSCATSTVRSDAEERVAEERLETQERASLN